MTKTKISVEIHKSGTLNDAIIRMITNHNEAKAIVDAALIIARCKCYHAEWVGISPEFNTIDTVPAMTLDISENGKPTISLQWKEIHELQPEPTESINDLENVNI